MHENWVNSKPQSIAIILIQHEITVVQYKIDVSHEKKHPTFHYTGWLMGILIMVYYNPYITG